MKLAMILALTAVAGCACGNGGRSYRFEKCHWAHRFVNRMVDADEPPLRTGQLEAAIGTPTERVPAQEALGRLEWAAELTEFYERLDHRAKKRGAMVPALANCTVLFYADGPHLEADVTWLFLEHDGVILGANAPRLPK